MNRQPFLALALALLLSGCGGGEGSKNALGSFAPSTVPPQGGVVATSAGVELSVPPGAVDQPLTIYVAPIAEANVPALPTGAAKIGTLFSMEPHGTVFAVPVTVRVPFNPSTVPPGATPALFKAQPGGSFVEITPMTVEGTMLVAQVSSFSFFAAMAKPEPVNRPPVAVLTPPSGPLLKGQTLLFSSANSSDPEGALQGLYWDFGDGSASVTQTQAGTMGHAFNAAGTFTVTLTAEDAQGLTQSVSTQITIDPPPNIPPSAMLSASASSTIVGKTIQFLSVGSSDADGTIAGYDWDLGDGTRLTRTTSDALTHVYTSAGRKTVKLTVTDNAGATASATQEIQVRLNAPPVASMEISGLRETNTELGFLPTGSADSDGTIVRYAWDFGDGTSTEPAAPQNGVPSALFHSYAAAGNYSVKLTVTDNDGASQSAQQSLLISVQPPPNHAPTALIAANISGPVTGQEVALNPAGSTDSDGRIVAYAWSFGDGSSTSTSTPDIQRHRYGTQGTATVRLTVTDDRGATGTYEMGLSVQSFAPTGLLNDTGLAWCSNLTGTNWVNNAVCAVVNWTGKLWGTMQDALFGRDALAMKNTLNKTGRGVAGFDFTRLGADGQPLAIQNGTWSHTGSAAAGTLWDCIRDNNTGLIWEVKRNDPSHLRHYLHQYTWYSSQNNGGLTGRAAGGTCTGLADASQCNTEAFRTAVNQLPAGQALCGFRDWRLPTREELRNIAHTGATAAPAIDSAQFPNTSTGYHWSGSPDASDAGSAWGISFNLGDDFFDTKSAAYPVRLVRSGL